MDTLAYTLAQKWRTVDEVFGEYTGPKPKETQEDIHIKNVNPDEEASGDASGDAADDAAEEASDDGAETRRRHRRHKT